MKRASLFFLFCLFTGMALGNPKDSLIHFSKPDSIRAIQFLADVRVSEPVGKAVSFRGGISCSAVTLSFDNYYKTKTVRFSPVDGGQIVTKGTKVYSDLKYGFLNFNYDWKNGSTYRLLISMAADSASGASLYSGYILLPETGKWKFLGTYKILAYHRSIESPAGFFTKGKKFNQQVSFSAAWLRRQGGSWKNLYETEAAAPVINLSGHLDSLERNQVELQLIRDSIKAGKLRATESERGIFYQIIQPGTGKQIAVTDTVSVLYKGSLFADGSVFDQTEGKPARFPLKRLIPGWQIGIPLLKAGGKIKLIIPSGLAYSVRTVSPALPPNSILVFEVEVLEVWPAEE